MLTIDRLWVEASNGHFGFSVQKKIWEEFGNPTDHDDSYLEFMEAVGWKLGDDFVSYDDLKFSPSHSLTGELPCDVAVESGSLDLLFSRATTCNL